MLFIVSIDLNLSSNKSYKEIEKKNNTMKLFITGGTGYIGGEILYQFLHKFPGFKISALYAFEGEDEILRNQPNGDRIKPVNGTLDSSEILKRESLDADIIINAACYNHPRSVEIFKEVLSVKRSNTLFLQIGGTGILADSKHCNNLKEYNPNKIYHDMKDIDEINSLPISQPHRLADKLALSMEEGNDTCDYVKSALICPPLIFGIGQGCGNKLSVQIPFLIRSFMELGYGFTINDGMQLWDKVHVFDVGTLFIKIIEKYLAKEEFPHGNKGYYFVEDGDFYWKDLCMKITEVLYERKLIKDNELRHLTGDQFSELLEMPPLYWGSNCRSKSENGRFIGWEPIKSNDEEFMKDVETNLQWMLENKLVKV